MSRRDPRPLLAKLAKERDDARAELEQAKYETANLREILEAYQEHVSAARRPQGEDSADGPGPAKEAAELREQLSVASSRNASVSSSSTW